MSTSAMLLSVPAWPALLALLALGLRSARVAGALSIAAPLPAIVAGITGPATGSTEYPWLLLNTRFGLDEADSVFVLFTALVWLVASGFARGWIADGKRYFFFFFLLTMTGNLGLLVAQDMPSFYTFFALMSFAAYGLIVHSQSREARHAAGVYLVLVVIGEAALVAAMLMAAGAIGATDFVTVRAGLEAVPARHLIIALAFTGFGIKAGVLLLHVWLPLAHPVAPAPASAVLSGTIIATGLVGWQRFLPVGEWALPGWGAACLVLGFAAAFYGAIVGTDQRRPKVVLAYSSISQMGILTVGLGMLLISPESAQELRYAIALFAMHHGLAKSALFLGAGLAASGSDAARRRWLLIGLALPSLALAGAPFTSGVVAKSALVAGEALLPEPWATVTRTLLPLTSIATALLMGRFLVLIARPSSESGLEAPVGAWLTWAAGILLVLLLPLWLARETGFTWSAAKLIGSLWPLGVALFSALIAVRLWRRAGLPPIPEIPAGDVLLPLERLGQQLRAGLASVIEHMGERRMRLRRATQSGRRHAWRLLQATGVGEAWLNRWSVALCLAVLLGAGTAWLAA